MEEYICMKQSARIAHMVLLTVKKWSMAECSSFIQQVHKRQWKIQEISQALCRRKSSKDKPETDQWGSKLPPFRAVQREYAWVSQRANAKDARRIKHRSCKSGSMDKTM